MKEINKIKLFKKAIKTYEEETGEVLVPEETPGVSPMWVLFPLERDIFDKLLL